ncbi:MAG: hypothetical protein KKE11_00120 [Gammaproteobacteria bacterium]|nr:hypothetical protein [Gammaproteobacteria bacterium]
MIKELNKQQLIVVFGGKNFDTLNLFANEPITGANILECKCVDHITAYTHEDAVMVSERYQCRQKCCDKPDPSKYWSVHKLGVYRVEVESC